MKVGIITYHRSNNYGAQLQAYALRNAIERLGCEAEVIDCNRIGEGAPIDVRYNSLRGFLGSLRNKILSLICENKRNRMFREFSQNEIKRSMPCFEKENLDRVITKYDYVITGSDQVWHPEISEGNGAFFLDLPIFGKQKIAYAPSFGVSEYTQKQVNRFMPMINDIGHLSVREEAGVELIKRWLHREAKLVVDPTMLLTKADWEKLSLTTRRDRYLLYFTILDEPLGCDDMVRRIAKEKGLKIVRIGALKDILKKDFINARANGPKEFLGLVHNAEFIVTSSFHGSVFAILFEKEFVIVLNNNDRNSRLETLAHNLGLSNKLIPNVASFNIKQYCPIDYKQVSVKLESLRKDSIDFLSKALK